MGAVALLVTIPGVAERSAQNILAEIGTDMSVSATDKHLASWAGQCPGNHQSAGKQRSGRTRNGSKWLNETLKQAALAATRTKNLQALYRRLRQSEAISAVLLGDAAMSVGDCDWRQIGGR